MLSAVQTVLNLDYSDAFFVFRHLCSSSTEFLEIFDYFDLISATKFNEYIFYDKRCKKCSFVHSPITTDTQDIIKKEIKKTYVLLNNEQVQYILKLCFTPTYLSLK